MTTILSVRNLNKSFGAHKALDDISLEVGHGEFIAMLGPSGCGKTTLLRCIAGFVGQDSGSIMIEQQDVSGLPPHRRPLNTVFQSYALFPHMPIIDNVAYGPRRRGIAKTQARRQAHEALEMVGLADFGARYPSSLSGGQQQRVALARALVNRPKLLLLDEPLSALDLKLRKKMQIELKHLQEKLGITFIFVTHDQEEAMTMADRVVVMGEGKIRQVGPGEEIYRAPSSRFVADFIGDANFIDCEVVDGMTLRPSIGSMTIPVPPGGRSSRYTAMLRPESIEVLDADVPGMSMADGVVEDSIYIGMHTTIIVRAGSCLVTCRKANAVRGFSRGEAVKLAFRAEDMHVIGE